MRLLSGGAAVEPTAATRKPTVLVYCSNLLPYSETFVKEQMLAYRKWRGVLIGRHALSELSLDGLNVRLLRPYPSRFLSRVWWKISRSHGSVPFPVLAQLQRESPSLLHAHFGVDAIHAWPIARALNLPMVVTLHGYDIYIHREWWEAGHWGEWFRLYPQRLLELAAQPRVQFIAVSKAVRRKAIDIGIPAEKISVHYIGIDVRRFSPGGLPIAQRQHRVLFVGRLVEKKGCEFLIRAFAEVQKVVPDASLIVVGDGELRRPLGRLAKELRVQVEFLGARTGLEIQRELALARVFCLPSVTAESGDAEGFGLVLLEAQASGVPVITSARGGGEEGVEDGITGLVFPERDVVMLASQISRLLADDACARTMALAGTNFVSERFDIRRCTQNLEAHYDDISHYVLPYTAPRDVGGDHIGAALDQTDTAGSRLTKTPMENGVTVLIAAYNAAQFLERAIRSALCQTQPPVEILVVDDGSTDNTAEVALRFGAADPRVRLVVLPKNGGPSKARNAGLDEARGSWIAILDADDAFLPDRLERLTKIGSELDADVVVDNFMYYNAGKDSVGSAGIPSSSTVEIVDKYKFVSQARPFAKETDWGLLKPIIRRSFIEKHHLRYAEFSRHGEDVLFLINAFLVGARYVLSRKPGYLYTDRDSRTSMTNIDYGAMAEHTAELLKDRSVYSDLRLKTLLKERIAAIKRLSAERSLHFYLQQRKFVQLALHMPTDYWLCRAVLRQGIRGG